jgi:MraZ protein
MFYGEYEHNLDDKGRVIIPMRFRDALADGLFVTRGLDGCLWLFTARVWEDVSARLAASRLNQYDARQLDRLLYSGTDAALDKQGRLLLPPSLRQHAELEPGGPVVVLGVKNRLEMWNRDRWYELASQLAAESSPFAEQVAELGI